MQTQVPTAYPELAPRTSEDSRTELNVRHEGEFTVLDINGPLAFGWVVDEFGREVRRLLSQHETKLVVDLGAVPFVDSAGIGALAAALNAVHAAKGRMVLLSVQPRVLSVLTRLRLQQYFNFSQDRTLAFTRS